MVSETTNVPSVRSDPLLPDRYPQHDLFICDVSDAVLKDVMQQMEHPFYSLSKKPEPKERVYRHGDHWLKVTPSIKGLATIYDKDILIYCISQLMEKRKRGDPIGKRVRLNTHELLMFTNRGTSGRDYCALQESIERLRGTVISTNIRTGEEEQIDTFGLIESSSIRRKFGLDGRLLFCDITLSDWVFNAIAAQEVLTLHRDYFRLRKPLERRIYEIARKHCGHQEKWTVSLAVLLKKSGSQSQMKRFKQMVKALVKHDHLPDYRVTLNEDAEMVTFFNRNQGGQAPLPFSANEPGLPTLRPATFERAKKVAPGYDVYALEQDWRHWWEKSGRPHINKPDGAFIGFCKKQHEKERLG